MQHIEVVRHHFDQYAAEWHDRLKQHSYRMRYEAVRDLVGDCDFTSVLDIGCGTGDYAAFFDTARHSYLGVDISERMIDVCRELYPDYTFEVIETGPLDTNGAVFDLALSVGVLEYHEDPMPHLHDVARILKPGGNAIITTQNGDETGRDRDRRIGAMLSSLARTVGRRPAEADAAGARANSQGYQKDKRIFHKRYGWKEMRELGAAAGLTLVDYKYISIRAIPRPIDFRIGLNDAISMRIGPRRSWRWLVGRYAEGLVCRYVKPE